MLGFLTKVFGSKSERDIKALQPIVIKINEEYSKLSVLSNDELRNKTL
jgi:preprotein translocase subunit SecA